ncbi:MAG: HDOD domain-containing protein [Puniceicoccaceae bacterium]|nr:MAG: HDOD domain-containing protein [Puniceicoccaceae bacterium]
MPPQDPLPTRHPETPAGAEAAPSPRKEEPLSLPLLLEFSRTLPSAPRVYHQISRLISDPNVDLAEVTALMKLDPSLTARMIRIANSAYFGLAYRVESLEDAATQLGLREINHLLGSVVLRDAFFHRLPFYGLKADEFCSRCLTTGHANELLAQRTGADPGLAYLTGLLHSIGQLVLGLFLAKNRPELRLPVPTPVLAIDAERTHFGTDHVEIASLLLKDWKFGDDIITPVSWQHRPAEAPDHERETAALHLAIHLADAVERHLPSPDAEGGCPPDPVCCPLLGLDPADLPVLTRQVQELAQKSRRFFGLVEKSPSPGAP